MSETSQASDDNNIKIYLRIKPKLANDSKNEEANYIKISEDKKCLSLNLSPENESKFYFDNIFNEKESQSSIFEIIGKPLCHNILQGINSTFISYGKKNTGKTYTIRGKSIYEIQKESKINGNETDEIYKKYLNNRGIFNFCLENIYNNIYFNEESNNFEYNFELSYIEIFDNCAFDYFNILNFEKENQINFNTLFNSKISSNLNYSKLNISSPDEAYILLDKADKIRKYILNEINLSENCGNIIITIYIGKIDKKEKRTFQCQLNFVEISSNFNLKSNNKYNISVKRSLETFSYIINQLSDNVKRENIIYENSILTNALKKSLGGNSKTSMLINISSYNSHMLESFQSINIASKIKNIKNNPIINEIITDNEDYSYYNELIDKNERLKSEKNYLLNYLANLNINLIEKNSENASKRFPINQNKKEKEEDLKKLSDDINTINSKIEIIENDINLINQEKKINSDKYNKVNISLFLQNKDIDAQNKIITECINSKKEKEKLINKYAKENINLDSLILKQNLEIKEDKLKKDETLIKLDKEISITQLQIDNKELILNNLKGIYKNLNEENEHKNKIKNEFKKMETELENKKSEKIKKMEELKNEHDSIIDKSKKIKQEIEDKNSKFNNFKKNLNQYNEYENITINYFKKFYDENNKKEIQNNNKFFDIQRDLPEKEKELKKINSDIDIINKQKMKYFEEQEKIINDINIKDKICKTLEKENQMYNKELNNLNNKMSILTTNIHFPNIQNDLQNEPGELNKDKNTELNSSIISYEISSNNEPNDLLLFKNNFNVNLDENNKEQLYENKKKLLEQEQNENVALKEKKNMINNEIYKFKINQLKSGNNKDKTHSQYNLVKIEENIDKINEKEKILENYHNYINTNYSILQNYLKENITPSENDNNGNPPIKQFKNIFTRFVEKAKEIDTEFEIIKKEFKEREAEYRRTNKEVINASLQNNPLLKNYEEIINSNENANDSISSKRNENKHSRVTMIDNKILSDVKNLSIYNGIYPNKRKLNDYLKTIPENAEKTSKKRIIPLSEFQSENKNENIYLNKCDKNKELSIINSTCEKENTINNERSKNNFRTQNINNKKIKYFYKSPDKVQNISLNNHKNKSKNNYNSNTKYLLSLRKN